MATRTAIYKGKTYTLLYLGATKFGKRAHLQFRDGSKSFWVSASLVTETTGSATSYSRSSGYSSEYCGGICPVTGERCCAKNGPCHDCQ